MKTSWKALVERGLRRIGPAVCALLLAVGTTTANPVDGAEAGRARLLELRREIARHDELYFKKATPVISDFEYDQLKAELRALETRLGEDAGAGEPIGDDRDGKAETRAHEAPMLSLEKAYSDEEVAAFAARAAARLGREDVGFRVEPKYDGVALNLLYEHGRLLRATTRGNGAEGDDVTANALVVRGVAPELGPGSSAPPPERVELRGEVFLSFAEFERVNEERAAAGEAPFANPRNLAAGSIRLGNTEEVAARRLEFVCFGWGAWEPAESRPATLAEFRDRLAAWGLPAVEETVLARDATELVAATRRLRDAGGRGGFPADGVVAKLEHVADQSALGVGPAAPRWALARKFAPERAPTRLLDITWQVGRTGVLTPVAELAPVELGGSVVRRATLHNAEEIARRDLRPGDTVFVEKAGEIIPAVVGVDRGAREAGSSAYGFPTSCPGCGGSLARTDDAATFRCDAEACPERLARRIEHLASPQALDVKGLGPALVEALVKSGRVKRPADVFRLREEDWRTLPRVGAKSAEKLMQELRAAQTRAETDGARFVFALGWPGIGRESARRIAEAFEGLDALAAANEEQLRERARLGAATARTLARHLASPAGRAELAAWAETGIGSTWARAVAEHGPLAGQVVVVTGTLRRWTRTEAAARLREAGAEVATGVTRRTTLLVAGQDPGRKLAQARAGGVEVIDEAELERRLGTR